MTESKPQKADAGREGARFEPVAASRVPPEKVAVAKEAWQGALAENATRGREKPQDAELAAQAAELGVGPADSMMGKITYGDVLLGRRVSDDSQKLAKAGDLWESAFRLREEDGEHISKGEREVGALAAKRGILPIMPIAGGSGFGDAVYSALPAGANVVRAIVKSHSDSTAAETHETLGELARTLTTAQIAGQIPWGDADVDAVTAAIKHEITTNAAALKAGEKSVKVELGTPEFPKTPEELIEATRFFYYQRFLAPGGQAEPSSSAPTQKEWWRLVQFPATSRQNIAGFEEMASDPDGATVLGTLVYYYDAESKSVEQMTLFEFLKEEGEAIRAVKLAAQNWLTDSGNMKHYTIPDNLEVNNALIANKLLTALGRMIPMPGEATPVGDYVSRVFWAYMQMANQDGPKAKLNTGSKNVEVDDFFNIGGPTAASIAKTRATIAKEFGGGFAYAEAIGFYLAFPFGVSDCGNKKGLLSRGYATKMGRVANVQSWRQTKDEPKHDMGPPNTILGFFPENLLLPLFEMEVVGSETLRDVFNSSGHRLGRIDWAKLNEVHHKYNVAVADAVTMFLAITDMDSYAKTSIGFFRNLNNIVESAVVAPLIAKMSKRRIKDVDVKEAVRKAKNGLAEGMQWLIKKEMVGIDRSEKIANLNNDMFKGNFQQQGF